MIRVFIKIYIEANFHQNVSWWTLNKINILTRVDYIKTVKNSMNMKRVKANALGL